MYRFHAGLAGGFGILSAVLIKVLYTFLVLSTLALLWAAAACFLRVRRHMAASETSLRDALEEIERERRASKVHS